MKKIFSVLLVLMCAMSFAVCAAAAEEYGVASADVSQDATVSGDLSCDIAASEDSAPASGDAAAPGLADVPMDIGNATAPGSADLALDDGAAVVDGLVTSEDGKLKINGSVFSMEAEDEGWNLYVNTGGVVGYDQAKASRFDSHDGYLPYAGGFGSLGAQKNAAYGDVTHTAEAGGSFSSALGGGVRFTGAANVQVQRNLAADGGAYSDPNTNVNLAFSGADDLWSLSANSNLQGRLSGRGVYYFAKPFPESGDRLIDPDARAAWGNLRMKLDLDAIQGDSIYGASARSGATQVNLQSMSYAGRGRMQQALIYTGGWTAGDARSTLTDNALTSGGVLDFDAWRYTLDDAATIDGAKNWFLTHHERIASGPGILFGAASPEAWYEETAALFDRLVGYKDSNYSGGFWSALSLRRTEFGGSAAPSDMLSFDAEKKTFTVGYDRKYDRSNGAWYHGIMLGYGREDRWSDLVDAETGSFHASLYSVYKHPGGFYLSALAKFNHYDTGLAANDADRLAQMMGYQPGTGRMNQRALGTSLLAGKRFSIGGRGWYWEPQAQFSYMRIFGNDYAADFGLDADTRGRTSLRSRTGFSFTRAQGLRRGEQLDFYADIALNKEFFNGRADSWSGSGTYIRDLGDLWGSYGVGLNWRMNERSYLDAQISYGNGSDRDEPLVGKLGLMFEVH